MTVKELIEVLQQFEGNLSVFISNSRDNNYEEVSNVAKGLNEMDGLLILEGKN